MGRPRLTEYPSQFNLYVPAARRRRFAAFLEHIDNEGKKASEVIMDLVDSYMKFEPGDESDE